jgi:hypothetical protein
MKRKSRTLWRLIAKSLGEKAGKDNNEADKIALIRLLMFLSIFITNAFIVFGVVKTHFFPREVKCVTVEKPSIAN